MKWRKSLYDIIEVNDEQNTISKLYDWMMMIVIVASIIPLAVRNANEFTKTLDFVTVIIFIIDYILRLLTADLKLKKRKEIICRISVYTNGGNRFGIDPSISNAFEQQPEVIKALPVVQNFPGIPSI